MAGSAEYKLGEFTFPRGWFMVAESAAITNKPTSAHFFGEDVVLFRGESGVTAMLGAYCAHMGTHLARSQHSYTVTSGRHVDGDAIRCPFHGWAYGPDGKCTDIPYFDGTIPRLARVRSWPVQERYGIVFCWNDPEGLEPDFDIPDIPEWDDAEWMRWNGADHLADLPCHPIEVFDNNSDYAHLAYLHGGGARLYENEVDGVVYRQRQSLIAESSDGVDNFERDAADDAVHITTENGYVGPGLNLARFVELNAVQLIATTPVDDGTARLWQCALVKRPDGITDDQAEELLAGINRGFAYGLGTQDGEVWANKKAATKIMQMPTDGPFRAGRTWYSQFFNPREKAQEILRPVSGMHHVRGVPGFTVEIGV
ncbi:Rieske 2Fe-2S domain-containing protein [Mycobacterium intracellulare]|uniref:Rieske 2Fe-2S domain-containing protein n=1 Tax=Mycobacterium intracellulare TaxID=1767 RepID=UPI001EEEB0EE|nr:Rieske 2Fe-2S domain-containing protein [Mycobacterium intracellulare]MEE3751432.1 Rieske 2Fe-2S domain-containing protein [Mycobacterium intracellulare]